MSYPDRLIDKRVVQRYIKKGMVDQAQYDALITALPDMEHNAAAALAEEEADEEEDDDLGYDDEPEESTFTTSE